MNKREFITLLGGTAAAWPFAARAQIATNIRHVGILDARTAGGYNDQHYWGAFREQMRTLGYVDGKNVVFDVRWANDDLARLPGLTAELVGLPVSVIVALSTPVAQAAKSVTTQVPIVVPLMADPVGVGLVASLARPGGNLTGINFFTAEVVAKRLGLLRELLPSAARIAVLVNPTNATNAEATVRDVQSAAPAMGLQIQIFNASTNSEIDASFATLVRERADALFVAPDAFFTARRVQLVHLATRHTIPATYPVREFVEAGGLMSYGTSITDMYRHVGVYTGRILKGAKPADLPVVQSSKFELIINLQTAKLFGLNVPAMLLASADEVIE